MSETSASVDLDALEVQFRRRLLTRFAPKTLLWLAALPEWTDQLAAAVGFPPGDSPPLTELLARLHAARLLTVREDIDPEGEVLTAFWLPASRRAEVGRHLRQTLNSSEILDCLRAIADACRLLSPQQLDTLSPWLQLVERHLGKKSPDSLGAVGDPSGTGLLAEVDRLIANSAAAEARSLVGAAQALGDVVGEPLTSSARRAQWRIDRSYRQALDVRSLRHYLPRPEMERSLLQLVRNGQWWALHLLGDAGVGKTMAIRDLSSGQFANRAGIEPFPVARVDFDHLDPRYPQGRPGELLLALIGELTSYSTTRDIERRLRRSDDAVARLHEALASSIAAQREKQFLDDAISAFASYLRAFDSPVVLVLDTCEELAKLHPPGGRAPAVDRTFDLLERIHKLAPQMYALLAGRRWLVPPPAGGNAGGLKLDPRDYLQVVQVGGFTPQQAQQYLDRRDTRRTLHPSLRSALLTRSTRPGGAEINPFDLARYCDWALAEPGLDAEELRTSVGDPYVEQRIIARLSSSEVRDCLPVAVELGRFDRAMIEPELRRRGIDLDKAFSGLVGQEWVSAVTFETDGRPRVIEVDEQLRPRLRAAIAAHPARFPLDRAQLGRDLANVVTTSPLDELTVEAIEAALRLLPAIDAARMWDRLEDRITETPGAWSWAGQATARAAAAEAPRASNIGQTVLAGIRATQAAAVLRQPGRPGMGALWEEVARLASRYPNPVTARRLQFRALCFLTGPGDTVGLQQLVRMWREHRAELPEGSILAAFDAITRSGIPVPPDLATVLDELCRSNDPTVAVSARLARASSRQAQYALDSATADVVTALRLAQTQPIKLPQWTDWVPTKQLRDRVRLARLTLAIAQSEPPETFPLDNWRTEALGYIDDIDSERLIAATIMLELCWRPVSSETLKLVAAADTYIPSRQPTHPWHNVTRTLCATIATAMAANGDALNAAKLMRDRREAARAFGEDSTTIADCDELLAKLSRDFRTTKLTTSIHRIARDGSGAAREHAWAALALVNGEPPASPTEAGDPRTWWRTQVVWPGKPFSLAPAIARAAPDTEALEFALMRGGQLPPRDAQDSVDAARRSVERGLVVMHGESVNLATALRAEALIEGFEGERYADLEIALRWMENEQALDVGLRFTLSDQPVDNWAHPTGPLRIDLQTLADKRNDVDGYAHALTAMVFSTHDIREFYAASCDTAQDRPIHLRLNLSAPPALHRIRWELLHDPELDRPVATTDGILFSRYLTSPDFRMLSWKTKPVTRALVVIANPVNLHEYAPGGRQLAPVDVDMERRYAEEALGGFEVAYLADPDKATLANLARKLEDQIDIVYLVCHGGMSGDVPFIFLENSDGTADPVDGRRLAEMVSSLTQPPLIVMLNSCQSAGEGGTGSTADEGILIGLGPRLAGAGIAMVIAMQGNVSTETTRLFTTTFFTELRHDGVVDRAVAAARRSLEQLERPDWWVPTLFSRLRSGRTYFKAEFTETSDETWATLESLQKTGRFTPVLGSGMTDGILGSRQLMAERWADQWQVPILSHNRDDLAKVAQYLRVKHKDPGPIRNRVMEYLQGEVRDRIAKARKGDLFYDLDPETHPQSAVMQAGRRLLEDPGDVYRTVAAMPVPVFVTTNWTLILEQALEAHAKKPRTGYFPWNDRAEWSESLPPGAPTVEQPLVYHLFGRMEDPDSLVLTEDDYFQWLMAWIARQQLVPEVVAKQLTNRTLLFLGYQLDDMEFKVVFQGIKSFPASSSLLGRNTHIGVYDNPVGRMVDPESAQDYLESYLGNDKVRIHWSTTRKFLDEYRRRTGMAT